MGKLVAARLVFDGILGEKPPPASAPRAVRVLGCGGFYHGWSLDSGASMSPAPEVRLELIQERIPRGAVPTTTSVLLNLIMMPVPLWRRCLCAFARSACCCRC